MQRKLLNEEEKSFPLGHIMYKSSSREQLFVRLAMANCLNQTGRIDYNRYGVRDNVGFEPCGEKFVDNFLLYVIVPDSFVTAEYGRKKYSECGSVNNVIKNMLADYGLLKVRVKAVALNEIDPYKIDIMGPRREIIYGHIANTKGNKTPYWRQEYKVACENEPYKNVLEFLRKREYVHRKIFLKDIDVTIDYKGSFNREEVRNYLVNKAGFGEQGMLESSRAKTILKNKSMVGNNCLTYKENINGVQIRAKIYNKMVQMLEQKSVRGAIGQHWRDWMVAYDSRRLSRTRNESSQRGLTRSEVTFYFNMDDPVPSDRFISEVLAQLIACIPDHLVYSTSHNATWRAYCETMQHSLVIVDHLFDQAVVVFTTNEITNKVSGCYVKKWNDQREIALAHLTLNGTLPIDVIEVVPDKEYVGDEKNTVDKNSKVRLVGKRLFKYTSEGDTEFYTQLISRGIVGTTAQKRADVVSIEASGLLPHSNCIPHVKRKSPGKKESRILFWEARSITELTRYRTYFNQFDYGKTNEGLSSTIQNDQAQFSTITAKTKERMDLVSESFFTEPAQKRMKSN